MTEERQAERPFWEKIGGSGELVFSDPEGRLRWPGGPDYVSPDAGALDAFGRGAVKVYADEEGGDIEAGANTDAEADKPRGVGDLSGDPATGELAGAGEGFEGGDHWGLNAAGAVVYVDGEGGFHHPGTEGFRMPPEEGFATLQAGGIYRAGDEEKAPEDPPANTATRRTAGTGTPPRSAQEGSPPKPGEGGPDETAGGEAGA